MRWTRTITVVDCHAEGESGQVVVGGVPSLPGDTVFAKQVFLQEHVDDLRRMILFEPRGSPHHNANVGFGLVPSEARTLCELGQTIKRAAAEQIEVTHPENTEIPGITQVQFTGPHARGLIEVGETFLHESVIGTRFESAVVETTTVGSYPAVVPSVVGQAWITGIYQMGLDPTDRFPRGFTVADTWLRQVDDLRPVHTAAE